MNFFQAILNPAPPPREETLGPEIESVKPTHLLILSAERTGQHQDDMVWDHTNTGHLHTRILEIGDGDPVSRMTIDLESNPEENYPLLKVLGEVINTSYARSQLSPKENVFSVQGLMEMRPIIAAMRNQNTIQVSTLANLTLRNGFVTSITPLHYVMRPSVAKLVSSKVASLLRKDFVDVLLLSLRMKDQMPVRSVLRTVYDQVLHTSNLDPILMPSASDRALPIHLTLRAIEVFAWALASFPEDQIVSAFTEFDASGGNSSVIWDRLPFAQFLPELF